MWGRSSSRTASCTNLRARLWAHATVTSISSRAYSLETWVESRRSRHSQQTRSGRCYYRLRKPLASRVAMLVNVRSRGPTQQPEMRAQMLEDRYLLLASFRVFWFLKAKVLALPTVRLRPMEPDQDQDQDRRHPERMREVQVTMHNISGF
jgi:hypothetical protein